MIRPPKALLPTVLCVVTLAASGNASAFHDAGVANCSGCHTVHHSQDGVPVDPDFPYGSEMLLLADSVTDVCLRCHATDYGAVMGSDPLNPPPEMGGGNFIFLLEDDINDGAGYPIDGSRAGHNVVSVDWGIPVDPDHFVSPGGTYPSDKLTCTSCHDPHGNQNFRLLRGLGSTDNTGFVFIYDAPQGEGISLLSGQEGPANHTAYRGGWSDWCANCHGFYHDDIYQGFKHPMDRAMNMGMRDVYNQYNGPLDPYGGDVSTAYVPEVPFESRDMTTTTTTGPIGWSRLACISCHRAHATSAPRSTRWDPNVEFLDDDGLRSGSYPLPNPYSEQGQRALCVKCHYPEAEAHGWGRPCLECHREGP